MPVAPTIYEFRGERLTLAEIAKRTGKRKELLWDRIKYRGMSLEQAVSTPKMSLSARGRKAAQKMECQLPHLGAM
jgi:hypothetical protein